MKRLNRGHWALIAFFGYVALLAAAALACR